MLKRFYFKFVTIFLIILFGISLITYMFIGFLISPKALRITINWYIRFASFIFHYFLGMKYNLNNTDVLLKMQSSKPVIFVSMHQSIWEPLILFNVLSKYQYNPVFIGKTQIKSYLLIYWYMKRAGFIILEKRNIQKGNLTILSQIKDTLNKSYSVIIFPEAQRNPSGQPSRIKKGISIIHKELPNVSIMPITLDLKDCWPAREMPQRSGTGEIKFHNPIKGDDIVDQIDQIYKHSVIDLNKLLSHK